MSQPPRVSIVIAHHNGTRFLPETLRSVEQQTFSDWEVLIVDDGSLPEHRDVLAQWGGERVTILEQQQQGAGAATQRGIDAARGDYIAFLDQDDIFHPRKLEADVQMLDAHPAIDLTFCGYHLVDSEGHPIGGPHLPGAARFTFRDLLVDYRIGPSATATVRRAALAAAGAVDPALHRYYDLDLFLRVARLRPTNVAATPEPYVLYRRHGGQLSSDIGRMRTEWERVLAGFTADPDAGPAAFALAQLNMNRYFAFLEYEQGRFAEGARAIARAFRHAPGPALRDPRNWLVAAGCLGGWVLPRALRRLAERVAGVERLST